MKRSALKPGKGFKPRDKPMSRGTSTLKASKPMARGSKPMQSIGARGKRMRQGKVAPNALEQAWMDAAANFGCIVCYLQHGVRCPAEIHHLKDGDRRRGHLDSIGLCYQHHRGGNESGFFISRHPWKQRFEAAYGKEDDLLAALRALLGARQDPSPSSGSVAL